MELIILNDGLYQLIPVTKQMMEGIVITGEIDCFDLCDILRLKLTGYVDELNLIKKAWSSYAKIELQGPGIKKIIAFGTRVGGDDGTYNTK